MEVLCKFFKFIETTQGKSGSCLNYKLCRIARGVERISRDDLVSSKRSSERALATRAQSRAGELSLQMVQVGTRNCDGKIKLGTEITLNVLEILLSILYFAWNLCRLNSV